MSGTGILYFSHLVEVMPYNVCLSLSLKFKPLVPKQMQFFPFYRMYSNEEKT